MDQARNVTAQFDPIPSLALNISVVGNGGGGTVSASPTGSSITPCNTTNCYIYHTTGQVVTLTANPDSSSLFIRWSGACTGTTNTCTVTMGTAMNVTANFYPAPLVSIAADQQLPVYGNTTTIHWSTRSNISRCDPSDQSNWDYNYISSPRNPFKRGSNNLSGSFTTDPVEGDQFYQIVCTANDGSTVYGNYGYGLWVASMPEDSVTANGQSGSITVPVGSQVNIKWNSRSTVGTDCSVGGTGLTLDRNGPQYGDVSSYSYTMRQPGTYNFSIGCWDTEIGGPSKVVSNVVVNVQ